MNKTAHDAALKIVHFIILLIYNIFIMYRNERLHQANFHDDGMFATSRPKCLSTVSTYRIVCAENMSISNTDTRMSAYNQYGTYKMRLR